MCSHRQAEEDHFDSNMHDFIPVDGDAEVDAGRKQYIYIHIQQPLSLPYHMSPEGGSDVGDTGSIMFFSLNHDNAKIHTGRSMPVPWTCTVHIN